MDLPTVVDIAIGLIFIYLILSLITTEIQEIIATIFQWRAIHLKRSIEILLTGGEGVSVGQARVVKGLVTDLYNNPLIKNMNQEARYGIEGWLGKHMSKFTDLGESITFDIEKFMNWQIEQIKQILIASSNKINNDNFNEVKTEFTNLNSKLEDYAQEYKGKKYTSVSSLTEAMEEINLFLDNARKEIERFIKLTNKYFSTDRERENFTNKIETIEILKYNNYLDFVRYVVSLDNPIYQLKEKRRSAPSYISAETFSTTLLTKLEINSIIHKLSCLNLKKFVNDEILLKIEDIINEAQYKEQTVINLKCQLGTNGNNRESLISMFNNIFEVFKNERISLSTSLDRIREELDLFVENSKECFSEYQSQLDLDNYQKFANQIKSVKTNVFNNTTDDDLVQCLRSSLTEAVDIIRTDSKIYINFLKTSEKVSASPDTTTYKVLNAAYKDVSTEVERLQELLPIGLRETLSALTVRTKIKAENLEEEVAQFKKEIEVWFDRSMARYSGVYKRNAKGVAFVIGLIVAIIANADTFHMVSKLSKNECLRKAIINNANLAIQNQTSSSQTNTAQSSTDNLKEINTKVSSNLANIPSLPLGWKKLTYASNLALILCVQTLKKYLKHKREISKIYLWNLYTIGVNF